MNTQSKVYDFYMSKKSAKATIEKFIDQFYDIYKDLEDKEQEVLAECMQQMFRKYYYSVMLPDTTMSPANMINTLSEREFGEAIIILPTIKPEYKGKKISCISHSITYFEQDNHHIVKDMESLLEVAADGVPIIAPGIMPREVSDGLKIKVHLNDRHYINFITLVALEAGFMERISSGDKTIGRVTSKANDYLAVSEKQKLLMIIDAAIKMCSRMMIDAYPVLQKEFSVQSIEKLLKNSRDFDKIFTPVFKKLNIDISKLGKNIANDFWGEDNRLTDKDIKDIVAITSLHALFDMFFLTPFGYYLQLIQPIYIEPYDMEGEIYDILKVADVSLQEARVKLFSAADSYDLTTLGEILLSEGKRTKRKQALPADINDEMMYKTIMNNYYDNDDPESFSIDGFLGLINDMERSKPIRKNTKRNSNDKKGKDNITVNSEFDNKIFTFKIKLFHQKRIWNKIEIKGSETLDDLHNRIRDSFELEYGHLYSFFMSNKAWDSKTEYSHPQARGRAANKVKIRDLNLNIKQKFMYIYDYGDEHRFEVELIDIKDTEK